MAKKKLKLQVTTPDKNFYEGDVDMIIARAKSGELGILPNHAPLVTVLDVGYIRLKNDQHEKKAIINEGFMEVSDNNIKIFTDSAEWPEDVDKERARKAKERAERRLAQRENDIDYCRADMALKRAINRIQNID